MKMKEMASPFGAKLRGALDRYKFVLLVILAGILLLTLPDLWGGGEATPAAAAGGQSAFNLQEMEEKLEKTLSKIEGAGDVTVILTVKTGARQVLAEDGEVSQKSDALQRSNSTIILSKGSGVQDVVSVQEIYPQFQGALVVCSGGGNPAVKLKLVEAVSALTGLSTDKISICKGK